MAAAKTEAPPAAAAKGKEDPAAAAAAAAAPASEKGKGIAAFIPLIAVVVLAPVLSFAVVQFVMLPQLKKQLALPVEAAAGKEGAEEAHAEAAAEGGKEEKGGKEGKEGKGGKKEGGATNTYEFANVVVNLSGTMGTRYLKTTFLVTGGDKGLRGTFEGKKPQLLDVTLNVLSALSLSDLEEAGAKNLIREKLIVAYNQAIGKKTVEQIYFSDFVVQ